MPVLRERQEQSVPGSRGAQLFEGRTDVSVTRASRRGMAHTKMGAEVFVCSQCNDEIDNSLQCLCEA